MVISLAVLIVPILLIGAWFSRIPEPTINRVDWQPLVAQARKEARFRVLAPTNLPDTWIATRARWTRAGQPGIDDQPVPSDTLALGFLNPEKIYIALDQRAKPARGYVTQVTRAGRPEGEQAIGNLTWQRLISADGRTRSLLLATPDVTAIVSGDTSYAGLAAFVTTLQG